MEKDPSSEKLEGTDISTTKTDTAATEAKPGSSTEKTVGGVGFGSQKRPARPRGGWGNSKRSGT